MKERLENLNRPKSHNKFKMATKLSSLTKAHSAFEHRFKNMK
jgi:hypothetical protein